MKIKAAIFDMDGTLVDSLMLWDVLWERFGEKYLGDRGFKPTEEDDKKVRTLTLKDAMELIHCNYKMGNESQELLDSANALVLDFYSKRVQLKPGVREFLGYCKKEGIKICVASATAPELVSVAIKHCEIEEYFPKIFSCGAIGKGKEHPDVFLIAQEFMGEAIEDTWVFEDSLTAIETASKIGMKVVGIYDRFNFGQDRIKEISTEYIAEGETLLKLIKAEQTE